MDNFNTLKESLKRDMKIRLKGIVSASLEKRSAALNKTIDEATDFVASKVFDEAKIEELAQAAKAGASYVAIRSLSEQITQDAMQEAKPMIKELSEGFAKVVTEALSETIIELILEKLAKEQDGK